MPQVPNMLKVIKTVYGDRKQLEKSLKNAAGTNQDRVRELNHFCKLLCKFLNYRLMPRACVSCGPLKVRWFLKGDNCSLQLFGVRLPVVLHTPEP